MLSSSPMVPIKVSSYKPNSSTKRFICRQQWTTQGVRHNAPQRYFPLEHFDSKASDSEQAFGDLLVRNVVTWTAMIAAYVQNGFLVKGLKTFAEMVSSETKPNAATLVSVLLACASLEYLTFGMLIHGLGAKLGVDLYISLTNSLIALYGKCGNVEIARALFDQMEVRTLVSWNAMIASYEQNNAGEDAIQLFRKMQLENIDFDSVTMVSVISECAGLGALSVGKWICTQRFVEEGRKHFESMSKDYFILPEIEHCTSMVDLLGHDGKLREAYGFTENMPIEPDVDAWGALLSACRIHGNLELAECVAHRLCQLSPRNVEDVTRLRKLLDEMEVKRICGQSLIR
ncbi:hypothetical protein L1987_01206 [Smallanthus sonchifolius]|uniref:Uncharacterized protein n=1 Tax=Smallanthus sonchifolius TaxID=185202 RepID=A0ACB9K4E1_9ASTR|nr:hypothetical protein L1987_01206 [Smallanthus sonchifolius]